MMEIEYRTLDGSIDTVTINDPSSIRLEQHHFNDFMDACDEEFIKYLEAIDQEVLTLLLIDSPHLRTKLQHAIKQAQEDLD